MHQQTQGENAIRVRGASQHRDDVEGWSGGGMRSMPGNSYDGHALTDTWEQVSILAGLVDDLPLSSWRRGIEPCN